jgi:hypothetical protein
MIRSLSYLVWSRTFLLGVVGLTGLSGFGRYFGQNKEIVSAFCGSVVCSNVGMGLTFSVGAVVLAKNFTSSYLLENIFAVVTAEILCPEVNVRPLYKIQTTSISMSAIRRDYAP